jgi:hypothetical protein
MAFLVGIGKIPKILTHKQFYVHCFLNGPNPSPTYPYLKPFKIRESSMPKGLLNNHVFFVTSPLQVRLPKSVVFIRTKPNILYE